MKVKELTDWLGGNFPAAVAEDWDNVGLLTGDDESEVKHVFLALDLTEAVLDEAIQAGADMIVTHHPMIFNLHILPAQQRSAAPPPLLPKCGQ